MSPVAGYIAPGLYPAGTTPCPRSGRIPVRITSRESLVQFQTSGSSPPQLQQRHALCTLIRPSTQPPRIGCWGM
ncbi:hypothetical protein LX36DRAFT_182617 [Colletotrichum falcatum]|nr:hypothetical protein LX36DRAFT_182617 [Colletotrichum falcatum]